jgi:hypothetical protein
MKKEYDFSKGVRGRFYRKGARLNIPVYLEPDVAAFVRKAAKRKKVAAEKIVNEVLRNTIKNVRSVA